MGTINAQDKFKQQLAFGNIAEGQIEAWLRRRCHYHILPAYDAVRDNKAPRLFCASGTLITPDILAIRGKDTKWIEAKHKTHFSWFRKTEKWETGIDLHHYQQYIKVACATPFPVHLLFLHSRSDSKEHPKKEPCPTGLFGGEILYLLEHESHRSPNWGKGGMVYWTVEALKKLATLDEVQAAARDMGYTQAA